MNNDAATEVPPDVDPGDQPRLRPRGSNQVGMRQFNERVVLQALRVHGSLAKAEMARVTGLTAQTIGLITARLDEDQLLRREAPHMRRLQRGARRRGNCRNPDCNICHIGRGLHRSRSSDRDRAWWRIVRMNNASTQQHGGHSEKERKFHIRSVHGHFAGSYRQQNVTKL